MIQLAFQYNEPLLTVTHNVSPCRVLHVVTVITVCGQTAVHCDHTCVDRWSPGSGSKPIVEKEKRIRPVTGIQKCITGGGVVGHRLHLQGPLYITIE